MLFADVPIWLINIALAALVALPFVVVACTLYLGQKLVRPGWALYWQHREQSAAARGSEVTSLPRPEQTSTERPRVALRPSAADHACTGPV